MSVCSVNELGSGCYMASMSSREMRTELWEPKAEEGQGWF